MMLLAAFSCMKEEALEQPVDGGEERFAEFDPVVRFGLDTYMGGADDGEPLTKTTYAGDDKTIVLDNVRYERINWNAKLPSEITGAEASTYTRDLVQIHAESGQEFGSNKNLLYGNYYATEIKGVTNPDTDVRRDAADATPASGSESDNFYWSASKDARRFYAVYPSPDVETYKNDYYALAPGSRLTPAGFSVDGSEHKATVAASINKRPRPYPEEVDADDPSREQKYLWVNKTPSCYEYMPNMRHAYMYAAAVMPGADAGYKKVPLRFKPLYSAVKLIVTARDAGAKKYRLKRVDLRTDLHNNGSKPNRADLNDDGVGTALGGSFSTYFKADATSGTTADFAKIDPASDPNTALSDTLKRLFIDIDPDDRIVLGDNVLKLTFLVLPIEQKVMTVDYTFEFLKGSELDTTDPDYLDPTVDANWIANPTKIVEVHRYLSLQDRTKIFKDPDGSLNSWYTLDPATKLYVKSNVPAIEYVFKVEAQSFFPRNLEQTVMGHEYSRVPRKPGESDQWVVEDFYSVVSYRDSSGVLQPLKWQVTGYSATGAEGTFSLGNKPDWLAMCGETIGTYNPAADVAWYYDPANPADPKFGNAPNGISPASEADIWAAAPWGFGSRMDESSRVTTIDPSSGKQVYGYTKFNYDHTYVFYDAGAANNGKYEPGSASDPAPGSASGGVVAVRNWKKHVSANYCDQDGSYYYPEYDENGVKLPDDIAKTPYAFDLSSHDIYGKVYDGFKNGDIVTTANCYVVSAPGWYRFPTVYGNGIVNTSVNQNAYKGVGGTGLLKWFKDHSDNDITQPWVSGGTGPNLITPGTAGVELVWEDANDLVDAHLFAADASMDAERGNKQKPFYWVDNDPSSPNQGNGYIYFYVNQISFSNAVLAAKAGNTTVWSWHIWCVPDPDTNLKTVAIEPSKYNFHEDPADASTRNPFPFDSVYGTTDVWKDLDLGQGKKDNSTSNPRKIYVEFKQYWRGKAIHDADARRGRVVVCFAQSGLVDKSGIKDTPAYQWGRKDPLQVKGQKRENPNTSCAGNTLGTAIQHPDILYWGKANESWHGTSSRWDNLWNSNVDYCPQTFETFTGKSYDARNGYMDWYNTADLPATATVLSPPGDPVGRRDTPVCKTIYDPCPPGYMVPNLFAFTAFNNRGMKQMRADGTKVAWNSEMKDTNKITEEDGTVFQNYSGFYYAYKLDGGAVDPASQDAVFTGNAPSKNPTNPDQIVVRNFKRQTGYYRREINENKVVRFYARGRVNGSSQSNTTGDPSIGFYWMAEPASHEWFKSGGNWSYGSAFQFQKHSSGEAMRVYPVTGGNFAADTYYVVNPATDHWADGTNRSQPKWQREHALYVRPMKEKDAPGFFTGSNMGNPNTGVNPF